jgi:hypothetical protein
MCENLIDKPCEAALRLLARGAFDAWRGLPPDCGPKELEAVFTGGETASQGMLSGWPTPFRVYQTPEQREVLHAWFDEADRVMMITIVAPVTEGDVHGLLSRLGPPEERLDPEIGYHADAHQWIYASRGLTLYVREHLDEIARVSAYPPTSAAYYKDRLGATDRKRYLPGGFSDVHK